ncbi:MULTISPECIES: GDP-mannose 4,6-dehydratase [Rhodococcus]|uniref:GDP-mannose 4,6-dehydratase n=1 Tax=Rhodococcus TaxID=1827 RepID=UPI001E5AD67E|nr:MULTISPECIES: GDP-mannose 4,6-dehydratase [Rhodococcus]MCD2106589.1 GDP-mannose 4,6-dehydratase [Rhodococcus qingshengii]MCZ4525532.1 GDP-mannose 4,6-dehydratase [Rhodococcus erythropolis]MDV8004245.1 GDP-mannose 4,6-dehydratase [Rhodococcus sp. IEGM 1318]MDZ7916473.1 GDP-mannose 4,6-dehydratase [Rhodococcus sp. (in: high G+C Gram-positive bacteria)]
MSEIVQVNGFWFGRKVLVTGGEGFIGSSLVEQLLMQGAHVRVLAHYKPYASAGFLSDHLPDIEMIAGDVRDNGQVLDAAEGIDTIFHLAALIGIPYSYQAPQTYLETNVLGTQNIVDAARRHGARRVVHTSTSEVYGTAREVPISETHPLQPQSPYSASKIAADMVALSYFHSFDTPVSICRPFNTFGPRQSTRAVIPAILHQLHSGAGEIAVGALTPTRDFTYVDDTARGFMEIAESERTLGLTLNLGTGQEISIRDLIDMLIEITGSSASVTTEDSRHRPAGSEVHRLVSDNSRVRELTDWIPQVSLKAGLTHTSEWIKAHPITDPRRYRV